MDYPKPEDQIGPDASSMKLEPPKAVYRVFELIPSPPTTPANPDTPSLVSEMLTASEIAHLRRVESEQIALLQKEFPNARLV